MPQWPPPPNSLNDQLNLQNLIRKTVIEISIVGFELGSMLNEL